ncbi:MAG TPA: crosslink repair DNA glycosylase YcaQ family protein [Candidatus Limnocylindria bacterium]|nr:crosslink repair DNA glycosylase YcaQ family protein [Candidatus Limnocylindria bacterium]
MLRAQRLESRRRPSAATILETIERLGYLQLDPTNVVARSHQLVLWSRFGRYDRADLDRLLWEDRSLYETISFILPTADRALHEVRVGSLRRDGNPKAARMNAWLRKNDRLRRDVLARLRRDGALPVTAFEDRSIDSWTSSGWTADRNVSQMLHFLMRLGRVAVGGRAGGKRMWTLADRWLPSVRPMAAKDAALAGTERALRSLGVATFKQLRFAYALGWFVTREALDRLEREGTAARVEVEGLPGPHFALASAIRRSASAPERTTLLSPFDNLIIDRARTETLFGLRYRMEIYVPKHLRTRGFWAMPILHGDRLIGTVDPKVDRAAGRLEVLAMHLEPGAPRDRATRQAIEDAVEDLAAFAGAREVIWPGRSASAYSRR